jgi:hypothetical protein
MSIRTKLIVPLLLLAVVSCVVGYVVLTRQFDSLERSFVSLFVEGRMQEAEKSVRVLSDSALRQAAEFSSMPEVVEAYEIASRGNMDDENDPAGQVAREHLRAALGPTCQTPAAWRACGARSRPSARASGWTCPTTSPISARPSST